MTQAAVVYTLDLQSFLDVYAPLPEELRLLLIDATIVLFLVTLTSCIYGDTELALMRAGRKPADEQRLIRLNRLTVTSSVLTICVILISPLYARGVVGYVSGFLGRHILPGPRVSEILSVTVTWLGAAVVSGVLGNAAYDLLLRRLKRRLKRVIANKPMQPTDAAGD